ncbi:L,D-transpeptidase [Verrucomicrobium spinosum]|uniref:L,D-transpeptidase n=1 Tax=Verrucomicrobium spinosum TaxID=2736 RepID=UPI000A7FC75D|nr:L,D-transpeptidase [Verrucomicrobium spinosum]
MSLPSQLPKFVILAFAGLSALGLSSCKTLQVAKQDDYDSPAYRPQSLSNVRVKVSLNKQMVYVMEGDKPLLVTATCVGTPSNPTPKGNFTVYKKIEKKRSMSYGFAVQGNAITPVKATSMRGGRYVGYPMPYWVEFSPPTASTRGMCGMCPVPTAACACTRMWPPNSSPSPAWVPR